MITGTIKRKPWVILAIWIIIAVIAAPISARLNDVVKTETTSFLPDYVESIQASRQLSQLQTDNKTKGVAEPSYMILVHGVPVTLENYYKLKTVYADTNTSGFQVFSWIDLVSAIESNLTLGMTRALNGTVKGISSIVQLNNAYNQTLLGLNTTTQAIIGIDQGYSSTVNALQELHNMIPQLQGAQQALIASCNQFLPALTYTYFNIVRAEALVENLTNAYQTGNLTQADIAIVVNASNLTNLGIPPLDPQLVSLVYHQTILNGGPSNFTNTFAAQLAGNLVWQTLESTIPPEQSSEAMLVFNLTSRTFGSAVSSQPDHRGVILSSQNLAIGQAQLLQALQPLNQQLPSTITDSLITTFTAGLPREAARLVNLTLTATLNSGCDNQTAPQALENTLKTYLAAAGVPGDPEILAGQVIDGNINKTLVLDYIIEEAIQHVNLSEQNITALIPGIKSMIETYDPNATGTLTTPDNALKAATIMLLVSQGVDPQEASELATTTSPSLENMAYLVLNSTVATMGGEQAVETLSMLHHERLLGASNEILLQAMPELLSPSLMKKGNMTQEQAQAIVRLALSVYLGETDVETAVNRLVNTTLLEVFPRIIEPLRGLLIEANGTGFIISLQPQKDDIEENAKLAMSVKERFENTFSSLGFSNATLLLGGNDYMVYEMRHSAQEDIQKSDRLSMVFVIIVLALLLESIAAIFLPFIGIGMGLILGMAAAYLLASQGVIDVTTHSRTIMFSTGLGLGIDYAVYVSKRFREAVSEGYHHRDAAAHAFTMSWKPVIAGATTASIGFGSMMLATDFSFISSIGATAPLTIVGVMLVSITFIPALLAYVGEKGWFWWPRKPQPRIHRRGRFHGIGRIVASRPLAFIGLVALVTVAAAVVMTGFQGSYDMALNLPRGSESAESLHLLNSQYDPGILYPVLIVATDAQHAVQVNNSVSQLQCVGRAEVLDGYQGRVVRAIMNVEPLSPDGISCVKEIRDAAHETDPGSLVGGMSSVNLDLSELINHIFYHKVYPVAIVLMFITLLVAYGGLASAITAVLSVVLAAYWGSALTVFLYEHILGQRVLWYLPVIVFTAILGVGMDYNSFYLARAREECEKQCGAEGVTDSIEKGTPTVLGLATIMAGAYAGLALTSSPGLSEMGLTLVVGVLLAGLNASLILTPPVISYLKDHAWWPRGTRK